MKEIADAIKFAAGVFAIAWVTVEWLRGHFASKFSPFFNEPEDDSKES